MRATLARFGKRLKLTALARAGDVSRVIAWPSEF
jgi:hypothetical protein